MPGSGVNAATVPGAIAGYDAMLSRLGTMSFKETFERAARIAEEGWGLAERRHDDLLSALEGLRADADSRQVFLNDGQPPALYSVIRNPNLARALRLMQAQGKDAFYKGDIAQAIVKKVQGDGGVMTLDDLAKYAPEWVDTVSTTYHRYGVHQLPPPGQGIAALQEAGLIPADPIAFVRLPLLGVFPTVQTLAAQAAVVAIVVVAFLWSRRSGRQQAHA